jgi:hypothetical protein
MLHRRYKFVLILLISFLSLEAQQFDEGGKAEIWKSDSTGSIEKISLVNAFKNGKVQGNVRYFFSSTINKGELSDYYANAIGGGIRYQTASFYNFKAVISGFYIFNLGSSDNIAKKDPITAAYSRYELGLFDITGKESISEINRLEEFCLEYKTTDFSLIFGRQLLNTPFINLQDGRMRPTVVEGLWGAWNLSKNHNFQGGWFYSVSPRSTVDWYSLGNSLGIYSLGKDATGKNSGYSGHTTSKGAFMLNYNWKPSPLFKLQAWDLLFENVFNISLLQGDYDYTLNTGKLYTGLQMALQTKVGNGGNENKSFAYYTNTEPVWIIGSRVGWKNLFWDVSLNYNHISNTGRYLMPREWGRDYFYSFMLRERTEGAGGVNAINIKGGYKFSKTRTLNLAAGFVAMPDAKNYYLNKYSVPSYAHFVFDYKYNFSRFLQGTEAQILYVFKPSTGEYYGNPGSLFNKVDMHLFNVVINFRF